MMSHPNSDDTGIRRSIILNIDLTNDVDVSLHFDEIPKRICISS